jgi:hypothetical protein
MPESNKSARIPLRPETRNELRGMKTGAETYDDVIRRHVFESTDGGD